MRRLHVASTEAFHSSAGFLSGSVRSIFLYLWNYITENTSLSIDLKQSTKQCSDFLIYAVRLCNRRAYNVYQFYLISKLIYYLCYCDNKRCKSNS